MAEVTICTMSGVMAILVAVSRLYCIQRQYPQLKRLLLEPVLTSSTSPLGALLLFYPDLARTAAFCILMPCVCVVGIMNPWHTALSLLLSTEVSTIFSKPMAG